MEFRGAVNRYFADFATREKYIDIIFSDGFEGGSQPLPYTDNFWPKKFEILNWRGEARGGLSF